MNNIFSSRSEEGNSKEDIEKSIHITIGDRVFDINGDILQKIIEREPESIIAAMSKGEWFEVIHPERSFHKQQQHIFQYLT